MRRLTTITSMSTAVLAAALLVPAGGTAEAGHRDTVREPLVRLALRVEGATRDLSYRAEHYSHHATQREIRTLRRLDRLEAEARDFRVALQRRGPWSSRTQREYGDLLEAYDRAERALYRTHARRYVRRDFREVQRRIGVLDHALQRQAAAFGRGPRHDVRIGRGWARPGGTEIAYDGRFKNADIRIRYAKREDDYDDVRRPDRRAYRKYGAGDDDSSDD